ncbi:MAG: DUF2726 domain-containing protein [Lautropia sp.]|nr:DUF2726 domain-containing protein [Lautropia sp.]
MGTMGTMGIRGLTGMTDGIPVIWIIGILLSFAAIGVLLAVRRRRPVFRVVKRALLTENEKEFLQRLEAAFPQYRIMTQVCMGALMAPDMRGGSRDYLSIRGRFAQKVVDYVILDDALEVVALVELDDKTHRLEKDALRDAMTAAAGYVTLRYRSREKPEPQAIRADLGALHSALRR